MSLFSDLTDDLNANAFQVIRSAIERLFLPFFIDIGRCVAQSVTQRMAEGKTQWTVEKARMVEKPTHITGDTFFSRRG